MQTEIARLRARLDTVERSARVYRTLSLASFVIVLMGFFGGLVMSAIKRDRGVKDWGHMIAGHGGFIDRLDSVVFSAPVFFHLVRFFWSA